MTPAVTTVVLTTAAGLLGLASRRWRTGSTPWTAVPLFAAAVAPGPSWGTAAVVAVTLAVELPGRLRRAADAVTAAALALLVHGRVGTATAALAVLLPLYALVPVPSLLLRRLGGTPPPDPPVHPLEEAASGMVLLAGSALAAVGLHAGLPLALALGLAAPAALPLLLTRCGERIARRMASHAMAEAAATLVAAARLEPGASLDALAEEIQRLLAPFLRADTLAVGINPPFAGSGPSFGIHPPENPRRLEIRAVLQRVFRAGPGQQVDDVIATRPGEPLHLDPERPHGVLFPVHRQGQLVAVVACAGSAPLPEELRPPLGEAVGGLVEHLIADRSDLERRAYLERRVSAHAERIQRLLTMSQAIQTAPDLRTVATNLVRATRVSFDLAWAGLLLDPRGDGVLRLTARSGIAGPVAGRGERERIPRQQLEQMLRHGRRISRATVIPTGRWPIPIATEGIEHLIVLPVGRNGEPPAFLVMAPNPMQPMLELEELKGLEILTEQAAPMIASALRFEELRRETMLDALTGIPNRRSLDENLGRLLHRAAVDGRSVAVSMLDLDDFKLVNDRHGHRVGDVVLQELARLLTRGLRAMDIVARYGGEEFCILMPGTTAERAALVLDRIRATVAEHPFASGELTRPLTVTVSVGVAGAPGDGTGARELLERADAALYQAKRLGKNRVVTTADLVYDTVFPDDEPFG